MMTIETAPGVGSVGPHGGGTGPGFEPMVAVIKSVIVQAHGAEPALRDEEIQAQRAILLQSLNLPMRGAVYTRRGAPL